MAMLQQLDAGSFSVYPLLSVFNFLALILKVCRNRFSCHGQECGRAGSLQTVQF